MPVRKMKVPTPNSEALDLKEALIREWKSPDPNATEPIIIIDERPNQPIHLYVVWSAWEDLDMQERSDIIMDAYEAVEGLDKCLEVSVALGVTPREAPRFGVETD